MRHLYNDIDIVITVLWPFGHVLHVNVYCCLYVGQLSWFLTSSPSDLNDYGHMPVHSAHILYHRVVSSLAGSLTSKSGSQQCSLYIYSSHFRVVQISLTTSLWCHVGLCHTVLCGYCQNVIPFGTDMHLTKLLRLGLSSINELRLDKIKIDLGHPSCWNFSN